MLENILNTILKGFWNLIKIPLAILAVITIVIVVIYMAYYAYLRYYKKMKPITNLGDHIRIEKSNIFKEIWKAIKQLAYDNITRDPAKYIPKGGRICVFVGRQGQGKTIALTRTLIEEKKEWPKLKIATNYEFHNQDASIENWEDLINLSNDKHGYIIAMDECQILANCRDWKNFDPAIMQDICYQRKQNKVMLLSTQVFSALDKSFKVQTQEIHYCKTFFKVFTFVVVKEPEIDASSGEIIKQRTIRWYYFGHTPEIRNSYDTLKMIKKWEKGAVEKSERLGAEQNNNTNNATNRKGKVLKK